jgi:glycosyltransferase involved in cell wall biosynthesis
MTSPPEVTQSKPLVSILIPAFNAEQWIADTLRSALKQTWERKEIIVVDDGSRDRTVEIARQFESDTLHVFTQKNQGAAAARNKAYSLSHGDYIQWLDADDLLAPDKVARQVEVLERCPSKRVLVSGGFALFKYRYYKAKFIPTALWCDLPPVEWLSRKMAQNIYMQTGTWLVSRELSEAAGPWDTSLLTDDDGEYFCRVLLASDGVQFVPGAKVYYRAPWIGTLSYMGRSDRKLDAHWRSLQLHIIYIRSLEDSDRVRAACVTFLQTNLVHFFPDRPDIVSKAEQKAKELGGQLQPPKLPLKYSWIQKSIGWSSAMRVRTFVAQIRWWFHKSWDETLFRIRQLSFPTEL